jgi:hypothetical protein
MKKLLVSAVVFFVAAGMAQAATEAGMREIQIQGSFERNGNSENDDLDYTATGQLGYNYFTAPQFSIGGVTLISSSISDPEDPDAEETTSQVIFLMLRASLYLTGGASQVVPYLGGQGGAAAIAWQNDDDDDASVSLVYGGFAGLKIFASENTSWNVEGSYVLYQPDVEDNEEEVTYNTTALSVGFSYYF